MFTVQEHTNIIQQIIGLATPENQADISNLLTQLSEDYAQTIADFDGMKASNEELTARNETLRNVNSKLFLKVGSVDNTQPNIQKPEQTPEIPEMKFEDLFNEKGDLK